MYLRAGVLSTSPTDLANFLACRHKSALDLLVAHARLEKPMWDDPLLEVLWKRGNEHEARYVESLRAHQLTIVDLGPVPREERVARTLDAMRAGAEVIVQAALADEGRTGYADVLRKVSVPSPALGAWSYEAEDTKLSRETRAGTILQLCVYTDIVGTLQGRTPEFLHVVTPAGREKYRFDDFAAFYRQVRAQLATFLESHAADEAPRTYPDPVDHCDVCRWSSRCTRQRRGDDHLTFVAGLGRVQQAELVAQGVKTLEALAAVPIPIPFKPSRGSADTYEKLREQARLQAKQRTTNQPEFELLPLDQEFGLTQLPEPRPGDLFLDLEGDPFARPVVGGQPGEGGREYLFGLGRVNNDESFAYTARWAFTDAEECDAFEAVMADIMAALAADPSIHVYHYAAYERTAFKRLMGRYATREADLDRLLRGRRFVDLYEVVRHSLRAGVENYSIKNMEPLYGFTRDARLDDAGADRRLVEFALETGNPAAITAEARDGVEVYNKDDCRSLVGLRQWLESLRAGHAGIARPPLEPEAPSEKVGERQAAVNAMRARLLEHVPVEAAHRTAEQQARYLVAYLLDWHDREDKAVWWEYFRLLELPEQDLFDEPAAVAGLTFAGEVGTDKRSFICRYEYPPQEVEIRAGDELKLKTKKKWAEVWAVDREKRTIDVRVGATNRELRPTSAFVHLYIEPKAMRESLMRLAEQVLAGALEGQGAGAAAKLLLRIPPRALQLPERAGESATDRAARIVHDLDGEALAIQGPPGSGKTFTGARMICSLVAAGRKVGVVATGHKVIRNLLDAVESTAVELGQSVRLGHRCKAGEQDPRDYITDIGHNDEAIDALSGGQIDVLGGTAWLWAWDGAAKAVDVLFVDEAGQMSLANAVAVSQAASSLVLLGDPQQLEQPQKGSHPDGVDASVLDHILEGHQTMPVERGLFLPITWRLAPSICGFTSEVFYEGKLHPKPGLERQRLEGNGRLDGSGLHIIDVAHDGNRNASTEEAKAVAGVVEQLLAPGSSWVDEHGRRLALTPADILIVAPYNAHVTRIRETCDRIFAGRSFSSADLRVGTVDKFQGQEAPVVIYSTATSRPEDAPRGMEFLYSLNRLNVATSRARCACILITNARLFEPDCRTPRQMRLANALCRYRERRGLSPLAERRD